MNTEYTAIIRQSGDWWIGWIEEIPGVNCQEQTREELIECLRLTLKEALEFKCISKDRYLEWREICPPPSEASDWYEVLLTKD